MRRLVAIEGLLVTKRAGKHNDDREAWFSSFSVGCGSYELLGAALLVLSCIRSYHQHTLLFGTNTESRML